MSLQELDSTLERLRDASHAIGANLLEVELDPNRTLLDGGELTGETAVRWGEASSGLAQLWRWHEQLELVLERARKLRGARSRLSAKQLEELHELLEGPSIELAEFVPLEQRQLLGGAPRCTPAELLDRSSALFDDARDALAAASHVWDTLPPRVDVARSRLQCVADLATSLGEADPPNLERSRERMADLSGRLAKDPLSVSEDDMRDLEQSIEALEDDLGSLDRLRSELLSQVAEAERLRNELLRVVEEGRVAREQALVKIADPVVLEPLCPDGTLDRRLEEVQRIAEHGAWREARAILEQWITAAQAMLEEARHIAGANRAPIEVRNELRGLLDAYAAKAASLGAMEDLQLSRIFDQARDRLYNAPSDLAAARELIHRYSQALSDGAQGQGVRR
jgi:hypothetical protein